MQRRTDNDSGTPKRPSAAALGRWLAAERAAGERQSAEVEPVREAEAALVELFQALPQPAPSAGFARRVMQQVGEVAFASSLAMPRRAGWIRAARRPVPWTVRGLAVVALAAAAALVLLIPNVLQPLLAATGLGEVGLTGMLSTTAGAVNVLSQLLAGLLSWWQKGVRLAGGATDLIDSPAMIVLALTTLLSGAYALRLLDQVLTRQRSFHHASL